jgi:hypothetical protein
MPSELMDRGDFTIFIDGINRKDIGNGLMRTAVPTVFPGYDSEQTQTPYAYPRTSADLMAIDQTSSIEDSGRSESTRSSMEALAIGPGSRRDFHYSHKLAADMEVSSLGGSSSHSPSPSLSSINPPSSAASIARASFSGGGIMEFFPTTQYIGRTHSRPSTAGTAHSGAMAAPKKSRLNYSWNEIVDRENLGVRPGEVEILPKDFEQMYEIPNRNYIGIMGADRSSGI